MDDFSLARPVGHLIMWDGSGPDGLAEKDGAKALSGAESVDTATTQLDKPSRTKNLINELIGIRNGLNGCAGGTQQQTMGAAPRSECGILLHRLF